MRINIKNMVCQRCIIVVSQIFEEAGIKTDDVQVGYVVIRGKLQPFKLDTINKRLKDAGLEIAEGHKSQLISNIKNAIEKFAFIDSKQTDLKLSDYLVKKVDLNYAYISSLFSAAEGITIEKYLIKLKIERARVMLICDEKKLNIIAWELGYRSVQHLSAQFKKVTGISPSTFKKRINNNATI